MQQTILKKAAIALGAAAALWLAGKFLLPLLRPFVFALLLALAAEPLVRVFRQRLHFPPWVSAGVGVTAALAVALLSVMTLCAFLLRQLGTLARVMPDLEGAARQGMASLEGFLLHTADRAPAGVRPILTRGVENLFSDGDALLENVSGGVLRLASGVVTRIPDSALGVGTWLIASFMISARLPRLRQQCGMWVPQSWRDRYFPAVTRLKKALGGWVLAQLKLMAVTFVVLSVAFLLLRVRNGILWAAVVALLDALPALGTGVILVPWSLVCFLQGNHARGLGLLGAYAVAAILRSVLEPKLVGKQLGLDPLITLVALYAGFRLWGLPGMILAPILAVIGAQLLSVGKEI